MILAPAAPISNSMGCFACGEWAAIKAAGTFGGGTAQAFLEIIAAADYAVSVMVVANNVAQDFGESNQSRWMWQNTVLAVNARLV